MFDKHALADLWQAEKAALAPGEYRAEWHGFEAASDRFSALYAMHTLVRSICDETAYAIWISTVPDEATPEDLMSIAMDDGGVCDEVVNLFRYLFSKYGMELNSLIIGDETF